MSAASAALECGTASVEAAMHRARKVYLAGPEVFLADAEDIGRRKKELAAQYGFVGLYPLDNDFTADSSGERIDARIYRANVALIHAADFGIANLSPFRGPSADVGTVFELGLFVGLGKPVFGYTNEADDLAWRVWRALPDGDGMMIEDFGNADNLMIDMALAEQSYPIIRHAAASDASLRDLTAFEECLKRAAAAFGSDSA
jgi:nucleoside 2-deoxyribosyltransferase